MAASSNGSAPVAGESLADADAVLHAAPLLNSKAVPGDELHLNGNSASSASATVCYLAKGSGQIDRLDLVLPLTTSSMMGPCALSMLSTSPPFSSSHMMHHELESAPSHSDYCSDSDRTPVNSERDFPFSPTSISQSSSSSSCRTVDSGTESICSDGVEDYMSEMAADRILKYFATNISKSSQLAGRRPGPGNIRQTSTDDDDEIYSDESTLSESSVSPHEFTSNQMMIISPESVAAAIDAKIKLRETSGKLVTDDKSGEGVRDTTGDVQSSLSGEAGEHAIPIISDSIRAADKQQLDDIAVSKNRLDFEDELDLDDYDDDECPRIPLIRSTSLKTGKTPPGTPRGKKIVRFADAMGLDLESVRHIVDDGPYMPPLAAFKGLKLDEDDKQWLFGQNQPSPVLHQAPTLLSSPTLTTKPNLRVLFCQPSSDPGPFLERVRSQKVCLENCIVSGPSGPTDMFTITCIVRVLNIGFEKAVTLRYTTNEWLTYVDVAASYVSNSCDGFSDKFQASFQVAVNSNGHQTMMPGQRLLFAVKYMANSNIESWDSNLGMNYVLIYQRS